MKKMFWKMDFPDIQSTKSVFNTELYHLCGNLTGLFYTITNFFKNQAKPLYSTKSDYSEVIENEEKY